jgi:Domain of Unknown Function (DUF1080)
MYRVAVFLILIAPALANAQWTDLLVGGKLNAWERIGDGVWTVMRDGTLVGQRDVIKNKPDPSWTQDQYNQWMYRQAWLYTRNEYDEFDLHLEYWLRWGGNSGVSIRDSSRAQGAVSVPPAFGRTPARVGYEIQIENHYGDHYPTGSVYLFAAAKTGYQVDDDWNSLDIEVRRELIRVRLNGTVVAEHPGVPDRPKTGPIGLQLHDQNTVAMFRNIRIKEVKSAR